MSTDIPSSMNNLDDLDDLIKRHCASQSDWKPWSKWQAVKNAWQQDLPRLRNDLDKIRDDFAALKEEAQKLIEPPLQYAIYLGPVPEGEREIIVGVGSARLEVHVEKALNARLRELTPGQIVVLNKEQNVVAIRNEYVCGETAEVANIISPEGEAEILSIIQGETQSLQLLVKWRESEELIVGCSEELMRYGVRPGDTVQVDREQKFAFPRAKPRLHVKAGGNEGTVVEISERLHAQEVQIGDIVRIEPALKFAFEKLPAYETGGLTLEEVPDVTYDEIGGLDEQIEQIYDAIELPYLHREQFEQYQLTRPKGIFLYGPPGCGKTMVAKAVANSLTKNIRNHLTNMELHIVLYKQLQQRPGDPGLLAQYTRLFPETERDGHDSSGRSQLDRLARFLSQQDIDMTQVDKKLEEIRTVLSKKDGVRSFFLNVKGPELLDKYVGETEHRIRKIFEEARRHATYYTPVVIFFDEMEAMFRTRGSGRSSDVETTIVPQFLSEIDGVESTANLIIIGASNRQDMIDPAILRPKRLDVKIKVDRPIRKAAQDIFAMYLLPTLPFSSEIVPEYMAVSTGEVVFRTAYASSDRPVKPADDICRLLPPGCDFRLALSIRPADLDELAKLPAKLMVRDILNLESEGTLTWNALRHFKAEIELGTLVRSLQELCKRYQQDAKHIIDDFIKREWQAETLILQVIAMLYSPTSIISVLTTDGTRYAFSLKEFISGATIANIADRAKRQAIKRALIEKKTALQGISESDLHRAIEQEFEENKEQLVLHKLRSELGKSGEDIQSVEVILETGERDPWSEEKLQLYKVTTSPLIG